MWKKEEVTRNGKFVRPSTHPKRGECLMITHVTRKKKEAVMVPFKKIESNKIVFLEEDKLGKVEGEFIDLFNEETG